MHAEALLTRKWLDICLPMGSIEKKNVIFLCLCIKLLLHVLNCHCINPWAFSPSSYFLPMPQKKESASSWVCAWLLANVSPPQWNAAYIVAQARTKVVDICVRESSIRWNYSVKTHYKCLYYTAVNWFLLNIFTPNDVVILFSSVLRFHSQIFSTKSWFIILLQEAEGTIQNITKEGAKCESCYMSVQERLWLLAILIQIGI